LQWLGRLSFSLYLIHVPLLYTVIVGFYPVMARLHLGLPDYLLAMVYASLALGGAHLFTRAVDEPNLAMLRKLRPGLVGLDPLRHIKRVR
jgi:peptidoglycan/LPS O-acetylase OafA/YrhL